MKNLSRGFAALPLILIVVTLLAIGGGAYYFVQKSKTMQQSTTPAAATSTTASSTVAQDETVNWKRYKNDKYGFSFDIPNDWNVIKDNVKDSSNGSYYSSIQSANYSGLYDNETTQGAEIIVYVGSGGKTSIKFLQEFNKLGHGGRSFNNEKIIKIGDEDALTYDFVLSGDRKGYLLKFPHNDLLISLEIIYRGLDGQKVFDHILSTFKFTK